MHPESKAIVVAGALLGLMAVIIWRMGVPFVIQSPGPTFNVLGDNGSGDPVIQISGTKQYADGGTLRMVTVSVTTINETVSLTEALLSWATPGDELIPYDYIYGPKDTQSSVRDVGQVEMVNSQDSAVAAALTALGYSFKDRFGVAYVIPGSASDGKLEPQDVLVSVDGTRVGDLQELQDVVRSHKPGDTVTVVYIRDGKRSKVDITLGASPDDPSVALLGIYPGHAYTFPFDVEVNVDPSIGGPSAGLVLSLAIYDNLTPGSLVGDVPIAGTGTISPDGTVGDIGGIQQKIRAASEAGAKLFLVPPGNCAQALGARPVGHIELVKAPTMDSALQSIKAYVANPDAVLPRCTP